ncbi:MAG: hypothetical protein WCI91_01655 [Candidatus Nomurabacteria bacterium]
MKIFWNYIKKNYKLIILTILIFLSIVFSILLISSIKKYRNQGELGIDYRINGKPTYRHHKARLSDIRIWMTFDYLNVIFRLNPDYLKNVFNITDPQYPNIRIDKYIKKNKINTIQFQMKLEEAITNYSLNK